MHPQHEFFFIIGSDNYHNMHRWSYFQDLKREVKCILVYRKNYVDQQTDPDKLPTVAFCINNSDSCYINFSSSEARALLKKKSLSEEDEKRLLSFFPEKVLEFIRLNNFYKI